MSPLPFIHLLESIKKLPRGGWVRRGIRDPESVSDHMWRMAMIAMLIEADVDRNKCIKMALVHDMGEAYIGDIIPADNVPEDTKARMELEAVERMADMIRPVNPAFADEAVALFKEFEAGETEEAKLVNDIDYWECLCQAQEYEKSQPVPGLEDFQALIPKLKTEQFKKWAQLLVDERSMGI